MGIVKRRKSRLDEATAQLQTVKRWKAKRRYCYRRQLIREKTMRRTIAVTLTGTIAVFNAALSTALASKGKRYGCGIRAFMLFSIVLPVAAFAQKVNIDFDRDVDFTKYKTYAYQVCHQVENPLVDKRIVKELESRVAIEGLRRAESDPDVKVTYHSSTSEEFAIDTTTWGYGFGSGWYWGHGGGYFGRGGGYLGSAGPVSTSTTIRKYMRGTLVVDIWDARTKELLWRGTATDIVSDNPDKNEKKLKKSLEKMFKKYPPEKPRTK